MKVSVLLIFAFVAATSAHKCFPVKEFCKGRHQEYSRCNANPSCQLTCENPVGPRPCTKNCVEGCVCKKGYVEDKERNCVKVEACPIIEPICSAAEHKRFTDCGANPICQKTCGNLDRELACPYSCEPGCICESGYVQDSNGNCIKPEECPAIQPICELAEHKIYTECNAICPIKTCENPDGELICPAICRSGCICEDGYLQDKDGNCVLPEICPAIQPICELAEHKIYTECNANCPIKTCENPDGEFICPLICISGCVCEDGYLQDKNGNCVLPEICPAIQPICNLAEHKIYTECDASCPIKTCENPDGELFCPAICRSGCVCESGYVQDSNGNCIKLEECPTIQPICEISQHEVYSECGAYCQRGCGLPTPCAAPPQDCNPGCVCEAGYVRNSEDICIKEEECQPICELFEHKIYTECNAICPIKTCENPDGELFCPAICRSGCICEDGYLQDKDGNCILPETCPQKAVPAICLFPQETGPCRAYIPSWGYNSETKGCTEFIYGGCQGNSNRFESQEECNSTCM